MSFNPISAAFRGVKKKIDRHGDASHDGKRHNDPLLHLSHKRLRKTTPEQLERYSNEELEALPPDRLSVLHEDVLARLDSRVLAKLPGEVIARLSPATQLRLSSRTIARLPIDILATLNSEVLCHALAEIHPEDLQNEKLQNALVRIGHQRLQQLDPSILQKLPMELVSPRSQQLPIQRPDASPHPSGISLHPSGMKLLPPVPQETHDFNMPEEYLDSRHEQQPGVVGFSAYNTAGIDQTAFSNTSPPSPTNTYAGRSSPGAARSLATCQSTTYHPPKTSDHRPSYGPRRNSSVSKGSHNRARSSSRSGPRQEREYQAWSPGQVTYVEPEPINYAPLPRGISETPMGLPTPPMRSSSRVDSYDLSPSEVIKRVETGTWKEDHQQIPRKETQRKETPKASRESIINIKEEESSTSSSTTTSPTASPKPSPAVASFAEHAERKRAATSLGHHHTTSSPTLNAPADEDDAESDHTNRVIQNHIIKTLKAERDALNKQLVQAKAENIALLDPLVKYLNRKVAGKKHESDGIIDELFKYCEGLCCEHEKLVQANKDWGKTYSEKEKRCKELEDQLAEKSRLLRAAEDNLPALQREASDLRDQVAELVTRQTSQQNEIALLGRQKSELERRSDNQIKRLQRDLDDKDLQLRQTESELKSIEERHKLELKSQRQKDAQEIQKQQTYYVTEITRLGNLLDEKDQSHQTLLAQKTKELQDTITALHSSHQAEITTLKATHQQKYQDLETGCNEQITTLQTSHSQTIASLQKDHLAAIARLKRQHTHATKSLRDKVSSLENDLVGNNDDFRPATDDSLKVSYRQLKLAVDMVTEPNNLGISGIPRNIGKIDTTRFLEREGKTQLRFLLRSVVWQRVVEGFFSEPFGMGALGGAPAPAPPRDRKGGGNGWEVLRGVVEGWRGLCGYDATGVVMNGKGSKITTDNDFLTPFFHSREANKWRSATFQSILMAVAPPSSSMSGSGNKTGNNNNARKSSTPSGTPGPPENPTTTTTPYWANVNQVQTNIITLLSSICSEPLSPEIQSKVSELCRQAGELALQFGAQRAQLALEVPKRGDQVTIGTESGWVDCEDGDSFGGRRGVEVEVELCVSPKVYRVGDMDGRNLSMDRAKAKVKAIVAGEVYPRRS
ncbi:hypothetical protein B0T20DRAFT_500101 [Sordaria brevicollis]|uniref:Uncharacterized protein n=1 Tax=Sordaria brevicollis TaxID=83679 RepID=A0AAE0PBC1_SORBR|nr:hypothetical protein B0T20DRAFT_500101 [Sordaria brevicollis]